VKYKIPQYIVFVRNKVDIINKRNCCFQAAYYNFYQEKNYDEEPTCAILSRFWSL